MIVGIGNDIIEIDRVKEACSKPGFIKRMFTEKEVGQIKGNSESLAGIFAAKEAVVKALGTGFKGFCPIDIEILHDELGKPYVVLYNKPQKIYESMDICAIHISISHCKEYATATAVAER